MQKLSKNLVMQKFKNSQKPGRRREKLNATSHGELCKIVQILYRGREDNKKKV